MPSSSCLFLKEFSVSDVCEPQRSVDAEINGFLPPVLPQIIMKSDCWALEKQKTKEGKISVFSFAS